MTTGNRYNDIKNTVVRIMKIQVFELSETVIMIKIIVYLFSILPHLSQSSTFLKEGLFNILFLVNLCASLRL